MTEKNGETCDRKGNLFVVSGPAGVGKGTLLKRALPRVSGSWNSISCTTRAPREGDVPDATYHFLSEDEFLALRDSGGLLEWACVHGHYYGTPAAPAIEHIENGDQVILEIDVQGAMQVRESYPAACLIFIAPPSFEELERRLIGRGTETPAELRTRLANAKVELSRSGEYDYVVVNDEIDRAAAQLADIMEARAAGA